MLDSFKTILETNTNPLTWENAKLIEEFVLFSASEYTPENMAFLFEVSNLLKLEAKAAKEYAKSPTSEKVRLIQNRIDALVLHIARQYLLKDKDNLLVNVDDEFQVREFPQVLESLDLQTIQATPATEHKKRKAILQAEGDAIHDLIKKDDTLRDFIDKVREKIESSKDAVVSLIKNDTLNRFKKSSKTFTSLSPVLAKQSKMLVEQAKERREYAKAVSEKNHQVAGGLYLDEQTIWNEKEKQRKALRKSLKETQSKKDKGEAEVHFTKAPLHAPLKRQLSVEVPNIDSEFDSSASASFSSAITPFYAGMTPTRTESGSTGTPTVLKSPEYLISPDFSKVTSNAWLKLIKEQIFIKNDIINVLNMSNNIEKISHMRIRKALLDIEALLQENAIINADNAQLILDQAEALLKKVQENKTTEHFQECVEVFNLIIEESRSILADSIPRPPTPPTPPAISLD